MSDVKRPYLRLRKLSVDTVLLDVHTRDGEPGQSVALDIVDLENALTFIIHTDPRQHAFVCLPPRPEASDEQVQ